jgi:hypothetical protein
MGSISHVHFSRLLIAPGTVIINSLPKCASSSIAFAEGNLVRNSAGGTIFAKKPPIYLHGVSPYIKFMLYISTIDISLLHSNVSIVHLVQRG